MTVTYTLMRDDLLNLHWYLLTKRSKLPPAYMTACGIALFFVGFWGMVTAAEGRSGELVPIEMACCVLTLYGGVIVWSYSRVRALVTVDRHAKLRPYSYTEVAVTIEPACVSSASVYMEARTRWQAILAVDSDGRYIFITTGNGSYVIAKTAFHNLLDAEAFLSAATQFWHSAKQQPPGAEEDVWPPPPRIGASGAGASGDGL